MKADRRAQSARPRGMSLANSLREAKGDACPEWCLVKPTLASPIFFLRWVNTDEHEFYSEDFFSRISLSKCHSRVPPFFEKLRKIQVKLESDAAAQIGNRVLVERETQNLELDVSQTES